MSEQEKGRLYVVKEGDKDMALVSANSQAQAIRMAVGDRYSAEPATPRQVADLMSKGFTVKLVGEGQ